jgi:hypothetical protein
VIALAALATVAVFGVAFWRLGVVQAASGAIAVSRTTMAVMRDPGLDDRAREDAVQRASLRLMGSCASILMRSGLAAVTALAPIWALSALGVVTVAEVMEFLSRSDVIAGVTLVMVAGYATSRYVPWS